MTDAEILDSWTLMSCYWRHRTDLVNLAVGACLTLCGLYRIQYGRTPTLEECQHAFWAILHIHPLFTQTILIDEKPHIKPDMHMTLGLCLARHVVQENWYFITNMPCP